MSYTVIRVTAVWSHSEGRSRNYRRLPPLNDTTETKLLAIGDRVQR